MKLAMIRVQNRIEKENLKSLMIMQVHDELVFDVTAPERNKMRDLVKAEMENAYTFKVPLKVDIFEGDSWFKN